MNVSFCSDEAKEQVIESSYFVLENDKDSENSNGFKNDTQFK